LATRNEKLEKPLLIKERVTKGHGSRAYGGGKKQPSRDTFEKKGTTFWLHGRQTGTTKIFRGRDADVKAGGHYTKREGEEPDVLSGSRNQKL